MTLAEAKADPEIAKLLSTTALSLPDNWIVEVRNMSISISKP